MGITAGKDLFHVHKDGRKGMGEQRQGLYSSVVRRNNKRFHYHTRTAAATTTSSSLEKETEVQTLSLVFPTLFDRVQFQGNLLRQQGL